jgi:phosphate ABC transporter ATP-binding protein
MMEASNAFEIYNLNVWIEEKHILKDIDNLQIPKNKIFSIMGPSGSGKSTFLKVLNRILELKNRVKISGVVKLNGEDIFKMDPVQLRRNVGIVFQQPNPFYHMSIFDNIAYALKANGFVKNKRELEERVIEALIKANLYDEVKDRLKKPASVLSGGQQQRLVIARALALKPQVLLLDEPTSQIDVVGARKIEELLLNLKEQLTIVLVSHIPQQAARISDYAALLYDGRLIEWGPSERIFTHPQNELTEKFVAGRL